LTTLVVIMLFFLLLMLLILLVLVVILVLFLLLVLLIYQILIVIVLVSLGFLVVNLLQFNTNCCHNVTSVPNALPRDLGAWIAIPHLLRLFSVVVLIIAIIVLFI
jgi:hypothetical protein